MLRLLLVAAQIAVFAGLASYLSETDHISWSSELESIHFSRTVLASDLLQGTGATMQDPSIPFQALASWKDGSISCSLPTGTPTDLDGGFCDRAATFPQIGVSIHDDTQVGVDLLFGTGTIELRLPLDTKAYRSIGWVSIPVVLSFLLVSLLPTVILVTSAPSNNVARNVLLCISVIVVPIAALIAAVFVSSSFANHAKGEAIGDQMRETLHFITDLQAALSTKTAGIAVGALNPPLNRLQSGLSIQAGQFVWTPLIDGWEARNTALSFGIPLISLLSLLSGLVVFFGESFEFTASTSGRGVKLLLSLLIVFTCSVVVIGLGGAVIGATPYFRVLVSDMELQMQQSIALTQALQTGFVSPVSQRGNETAFLQLSDIYSGLGTTQANVKVNTKSVLLECINFIGTNGGLLHTTKTAALFNGLTQIAQQLPQSSLGGVIQNISIEFSELEMRFLMMIFQQNTTYFEKFAPALVKSITGQLGMLDNVGSNDITAFDSGLSAFLTFAERARTEVLQLSAATSSKSAVPAKLIGVLEDALTFGEGKLPPMRMNSGSTASAIVNIYAVSGYCCVALLATSCLVLFAAGPAGLSWISSNRRVLLLLWIVGPLAVMLVVHNTALTTNYDRHVLGQQAAEVLLHSLQDVESTANQCYRLWKASETANETTLGERATKCLKRYTEMTQRFRSWSRQAEWSLPLSFTLSLDHFGQLLMQTGTAAAHQFVYRSEHVSLGDLYWSERLAKQSEALTSAFVELDASCPELSSVALTVAQGKVLFDALSKSNSSAPAPLVFTEAQNCTVDVVEATMSAFQVSLHEVVSQPDLSFLLSDLSGALSTVVAEGRIVERGIRSLNTETKAQRATFWAPVIGTWVTALVLHRVDLFSFHCDMLQRRC